VQSAIALAARQRLQPDAEIGGVGADPTKAFSGAADRFRESETDVANAAVNWRDYGTSRWQLAVEMLHQLRVQAEGGTPTFGGEADIAVRS
jgi:hypothetical protein